MTFDPATEIQNYLVFGEFGDVNPSICDSSTYTFNSVAKMEELFDHEIEGCFLYSRQFNPTNKYLAAALARMEDGECAQVTSSGMAAISSALLELCSSGDEIVCGHTIYGGTYALLTNLLPRFGITTQFAELSDEQSVRAAITPNTRVLYCESMSNPLLEISDIPKLSAIAKEHGLKLVVDNTFSPLMLSPLRLGADIVVHSMTKFINGTSDCVARCIVSSHDFIDRLNNTNHGACMLLGPVLDSIRAAGILKNLHSLHIRMPHHGKNAHYLAQRFQDAGLDVHYPGSGASSATSVDATDDESGFWIRRHVGRRRGRQVDGRSPDDASAGREGWLSRGQSRLFQNAFQRARSQHFGRDSGSRTATNGDERWPDSLLSRIGQRHRAHVESDRAMSARDWYHSLQDKHKRN
jgi:methionine-gamma-lyase